jgi:DEAD/DEAH box helicase domain-containing protein
MEQGIDIFRLLNEIKAASSYQNQIVHIEEIPASEALYTSLKLGKKVEAALSELGVEDLYSHQTEAIDKIREGKNIVLCTITASRKSLTYLIQIFETILDDPKATALYISPLNALVNDQLKAFVEFEETLIRGRHSPLYRST